MKNVVITGGNSGLGLATAKKIAANKDYRVILACRKLEKGEEAKAQIISETGNENIDVMRIDTSSLKMVRDFVEQFVEKYGTVDVLINNAGISPQNSGMTEDGFELVFATNYLGHFLLTNLLIPHMAEDARIFSVTSDMHNPPRGELEWKGADYLAYEAVDDRSKYSYSKLCQIYFTHSLDEMFKEKNMKIVANSFNPGFMAETNFSGMKADKARSFMVKKTMPDRYGELGTSSDALAKLATDDAYKSISGEYFDRSTNTAKSSELSYNKENEKELWEKSCAYTGLSEN